MEELKLKITGALSSEAIEGMLDEAIINFIRKEAEEKAKKYISEEYDQDVDVLAEYIVIDGKLNVKRKIAVRMFYSKEFGAVVKRNG